MVKVTLEIQSPLTQPAHLEVSTACCRGSGRR